MKTQVKKDYLFEKDDIENLIRLYMRKKHPEETINSIDMSDIDKIMVYCESKIIEKETEEE